MLSPSFDFAQDIRKKPFTLSLSKGESRAARDSGQACRSIKLICATACEDVTPRQGGEEDVKAGGIYPKAIRGF